MKQMTSIRIWFMQTFLMMSFISSLILFIGLQIYLYLEPDSGLTTTLTFWLWLYCFIVLAVAGIYFSLRGSSLIKGRLSDILLFITTLRRGKFTERITTYEKDEIGLISEELNQLAEYLQEQVYSLQRLAEEKTELSKTAMAAATMEERQRLARDLHDVVSQQLFALSMMSSASLRLFDQDPEKARKQLEQISEIAGKAQGEMRALLLHLRPVQLSGESLCEGIVKLIQELKHKTSLTFEASVDEIENLSNAAEEHIFRIVQEALSNILRHADATKVKLLLAEESGYIQLYIGDNGKGFDIHEERMASYGLKTMRERCEQIGGTYNIRSKTQEGTYIDIRIPAMRREE
ncbi:sensor histidine kinase [Mesobacillus subterraneus]|uniref:sensor histidine kinase n=1 Tax=Mesobacillus subterraneus TaxID=285983 RepID=UPI00203AED4B|nr:sensor histidine kinase [Mesobacillus subterraneus]MCM3662916.1 sensor histidine kinase [Mesobacillus subterraneus]MCM3682908.1 sensor histidine kinase [Mesobacillus subterraneus]